MTREEFIESVCCGTETTCGRVNDCVSCVESIVEEYEKQICREFAGEIINILNGIDRDIAVMVKDIVEEDVLAEMEQEE